MIGTIATEAATEAEFSFFFFFGLDIIPRNADFPIVIVDERQKRSKLDRLSSVLHSCGHQLAVHKLGQELLWNRSLNIIALRACLGRVRCQNIDRGALGCQ